MAIVDGVLADLQKQALQKATIEAAVVFQAIGTKKVVQRMRQEIEAARYRQNKKTNNLQLTRPCRNLRDHYKRERDEARAELKRLRDSIAALSGAAAAASPVLPAAPSPVAASTPYSAPGSFNGRSVVQSEAAPEISRSASFSGRHLAAVVREAVVRQDDDAGTVYQMLGGGDIEDDNRTIYGQFD